MQIDIHRCHLTYCSNIHPGESWQATFSNLDLHTRKVREEMGTSRFGIGLRVAHLASLDLMKPENLSDFQQWLSDSGMYVFTINGFPYGGFHHQVVKDKVHYPDWSTPERTQYTVRLFRILSQLLPEDMDGGVSTSPISYRFWHNGDASGVVKQTACENMMQVVIELNKIFRQTGKVLHLDIEPEPDGVLETSEEFVRFFEDYLLGQGIAYLTSTAGLDRVEAEEAIRRHLQLCYDVCHFAVGFEKADDVLNRMEKAGIGIGRIQISAAMSSGPADRMGMKSRIMEELKQFDEPVYLHQAVVRQSDGALKRYKDLQPALSGWSDFPDSELRTHFHVPVFTADYGTLLSTQKDIVDVLSLWKRRNFTNHLEVETYTWDVLPGDMRSGIVESIVRELNWVLHTLER